MPKPDDFELIESRELSRGFFRFEELVLRHRRFDGGTSPVMKRERLHIGRTVVVLPFDIATGNILLIKQFRAAAVELPGGPWVIECVGGILGENEDPMWAAKRELVEETGVQARRLEAIGHYAPNPAVTTEFAAMFLAAADLSHAGGVHGLANEDEDIQSFVVSLDEAVCWLDDGRILCANAQIPIRWLAAHRLHVVERWQKAA